MMHHARACMIFEDRTTRDLSYTVLRVGNNAYCPTTQQK